jgi:RNA polymerase sigma factor (sigma-70 family)
VNNGTAHDQQSYERPRDTASSPSDAALIVAVRRDPPDEVALNTLVSRYWSALFARCELLTLDRQAASDLAQETWCRMLRARRRLDPDRNFAAYLATIATNLWRDQNRAARRAGALADRHLASFDAALGTDDGDSAILADVVPDPHTMAADEQAMLKLDIDRALRQLTPQLRDVLIARFLDDESAAEIGKRYGRTEQTITAWVRQALREMKVHLGAARRAGARAGER